MRHTVAESIRIPVMHTKRTVPWQPENHIHNKHVEQLEHGHVMRSQAITASVSKTGCSTSYSTPVVRVEGNRDTGTMNNTNKIRVLHSR